MWHNKYILYALACFLAFGSCKKQEPSHTVIFSDYLQKEFELEIPTQEHYFILLSKMSCPGCVSNTQDALLKRLNKHAHLIPKLTFIYSNKLEANPALIQKVTSYFDSYEALDKLPLIIDNVIIVKTNNQKVLEWTFVEPRNMVTAVASIK